MSGARSRWSGLLLALALLLPLAAQAQQRVTVIRLNPENLAMPESSASGTGGVLPLEGSDSDRLRQAVTSWAESRPQ